MEAFVYLRVHPGSIVPVRNQLTSSAVARRSIVVIGDWDVLCLIDGPDLASIGTGVLSEIQMIEGIAGPTRRRWSLRIGSGSWGSEGSPHRSSEGLLRPHRRRARGGRRALRAALRDRRGVRGRRARWPMGPDRVCAGAVGSGLRDRARQDPCAPGRPDHEHARLGGLRGPRRIATSSAPGRRSQEAVVGQSGGSPDPGRECEPHPLQRDQRLLDPIEASGSEPLEHVGHEPFRGGGSGREADDLGAVEPARSTSLASSTR